MTAYVTSTGPASSTTTITSQRAERGEDESPQRSFSCSAVDG